MILGVKHLNPNATKSKTNAKIRQGKYKLTVDI
jgi:hypothetical protein